MCISQNSFICINVFGTNSNMHVFFNVDICWTGGDRVIKKQAEVSKSFPQCSDQNKAKLEVRLAFLFIILDLQFIYKASFK
jgi:hypothetical protein